jgi:DNA-binding response OmpR family regulator
MSSDPLGPQRSRIWLCEPDALFRTLLGEWLQRAGYEPMRCEVGMSVNAPAVGVGLVVADVAAPRQDGAECIAALRERFPQTKVLAISAQFTAGMQGVTAAAVELGADAVLAKPFAAKAFIESVELLLGT